MGVEIRAKLDQAYGMWPAIWMLSEKVYLINTMVKWMLWKSSVTMSSYQTHNHYTISLIKMNQRNMPLLKLIQLTLIFIV